MPDSEDGYCSAEEGQDNDYEERWHDADDQAEGVLNLHRACFLGDLLALQRILATKLSREQFNKLDPHGHTALHLAVLRHHRHCVKALLDAGCPAKTKSAHSWRPCHEAAVTGQRDVALMLAYADLEQQRLRGKEKRKELMGCLASMPDFSMQLKWTLDSSVPGVGLLLKKFAPNDVYRIWKQGSLLRMDGTLKGVDDGSSSMLPGWKRGHFSIVYDGTGNRSQGAFIDHEKKTYTDLKEMHKKGSTMERQREVAEAEVDDMLQQKRLTRKKIKPKAFRFEPALGWFGQVLTEKIEGWHTKVYDASANMVRMTRFRGARDVTCFQTFEDYLASELEPDIIQEVPINPYHPASYKKSKPKPTSDPQLCVAGSKTAGGCSNKAGKAQSVASKDDADSGAGGKQSSDQKAQKCVSRNAVEYQSAKDGCHLVDVNSLRGGRAAGQSHAAEVSEGGGARGQQGQGCEGGVHSSKSGGGGSEVREMGGEHLYESASRAQGAMDGGGGGGGGEGHQESTSKGGLGVGSVEQRHLSGKGACSSESSASQDQSRGKMSKGEEQAAAEAAELEAQLGLIEDNCEDQEEEEEQEQEEGPPPKSFKAAPADLKRHNRLSGRCWMASKFPLSLKQVLPLLQLIGGTNKHFYKVESFMQNYADREEFPVRVDIPLILTVSIRLAFKAFERLTASQHLSLAFFSTAPAGYRKKDPPEIVNEEDGLGDGEQGTNQRALANAS